MSKHKKFYFNMTMVVVFSLLIHYLILWALKTDEPFFFLIAFAFAAAAITSWIFDKIERKNQR